MKSKKARVLSLLAAIGLLAAVTGTVAANTAQSPFIFSSATSTFNHSLLTLTYRCDTIGIAERTRSSNNNIRVGASFKATVQCFNGNLMDSSTVSSGIFNVTTTPACSVAQGNAAAGATTIFH